MQLTEHGLLGSFSPVNATLRKLPAVGAYTLAPEHLVFLVEQDDADVGSEPFTVEHNQPQNLVETIIAPVCPEASPRLTRTSRRHLPARLHESLSILHFYAQ